MKKIIILFITAVITLSGCQDFFLDLDPRDSVTEAVYFTKPEHFKASANYLYRTMISWLHEDKDNKTNVFDFMAMGSDLTASGISSSGQAYGRGVVNLNPTDVYWFKPYQYIREANVLLEKADTYGGDATEIAEYVAAAKFFRAWQHFFLMQRYGV